MAGKLAKANVPAAKLALLLPQLVGKLAKLAMLEAFCNHFGVIRPESTTQRYPSCSSAAITRCNRKACGHLPQKSIRTVTTLITDWQVPDRGSNE
eukprot:jgi/Botrbrau1/10071/Bobra.0355s0026.1